MSTDFRDEQFYQLAKVDMLHTILNLKFGKISKNNLKILVKNNPVITKYFEAILTDLKNSNEIVIKNGNVITKQRSKDTLSSRFSKINCYSSNYFKTS